MMRRGDVDLRFEDLAFPAGRWQSSRGILDAADERDLSALRGPDADFAADATLRFARDFSVPRSGRAFVFDTPEFHVLRPGVMRKLRESTAGADRVHMLVPSRWAAEAYLRFGIAPGRVHVVPHGIDPRVLHPDEARRKAVREKLGLAGHFVFLSVGAMTDNKGIDLLLRAFAQVATPRYGSCSKARTTCTPPETGCAALLPGCPPPGARASARGSFISATADPPTTWPISFAPLTATSRRIWRRDSTSRSWRPPPAARRRSAPPAAPPTTSPLRRSPGASERAPTGSAPLSASSARCCNPMASI